MFLLLVPNRILPEDEPIRKQRTNPHVFQLTGGTYDVVVKTVEVDGRPEHRFSNIYIQGGGGRVEHSHDFASGMLQVGAVHAGALVDVTVQIRMQKARLPKAGPMPRPTLTPRRLYSHQETTRLFSKP